MKKKILSALLLAAFGFAVTSTVTSCKDYDDDINNLQTQIDALTPKLTALQTDLTNQLNSAKSELQTAIAAKADAKTVTDLAGKVATLETQLGTANDAISKLRTDVNGALKDIATLTGDYKTLRGDLDDEVKAREALEANLKVQLAAFEKYGEEIKKLQDADYQGQINTLKGQYQSIKDADYQKQIDELKEKVKNFATDGTIKELQDKVKKLQEDIAGFNSNLDAMTVLVLRQLNSIALVPALYVDGIEAIEFLSLQYTPVKPGTSGLVSQSGAQVVRIDNGETEATYRLNPATVKRESIDEANMEFVAAIAETRAAANVLQTSPVMFNGIKSYENGLLTVKLKKNVTSSLNLSNNNIYIVALKTPRKADAEKGIEAADIYSENSRLVETTITPRIAALPWDVRNAAMHHYSDSTTIWGSRVDQDELVCKKINYNETFDLTEIVTGCYSRNISDTQITKEQLKSYGLEFRFAIPTTTYKNAADNNTDQQKFAVVTPEGIISSKTPAGVTDNQAVVGKEPIVRVELWDVNNNKLVDQRYLKIKWTMDEKEAVQLADKNSEAVLGCDDVTAEFLWEEFVNEVYAKVRTQGMSQADFKAIYTTDIEEAIGWTTNWGTPKKTSAPASGTTFNALPTIGQTTNVHGDALIAQWILNAGDIETVYNSSASDTKTFTAKVTFKSSLPTEYPDLWFNWNFTIKLPKLPSINGYYDQYWLSNKVGEEHDVLPVQFNTPAQTLAYCVYDNNLMNAFTYELVNGVRQFIVKDIPECGTWDLQFNLPQSMTGYAPNYTTSSVNINGGAWQSGGVWCNTTRDPYATFVAYKLMKGTDQALQLNWDQDHVSWCGNPAHKEARLFADHNNPANQGLLNPLSQNDITGSDGTVTPERTHTKPINMTVWATLNNWNYIPVLKYKIYLVEPLRINGGEIDDKLQDGVVSGDILDCTGLWTLTDFRGYLVSEEADNTYPEEQRKYTKSLWDYYEVQGFEVDEANIKYTFKRANGSVKPDKSLSYSNSMTAQQISDETNGNIVLSMTYDPVTGNLIFKNNGGSNIEADIWAYIPVKVKYGFGELTQTFKVLIVPHGHK